MPPATSGVFHVDRIYWQGHLDLIVLAGHLVRGDVLAGDEVELPVSIRGPGWVPIRDVQTVDFADGTARLCVVIDYGTLESAPFMEFRDVEGLDLSIRPVSAA